uniref:Uncharacterized protein n=1 Tax=Zea mays TaxID=4577 RepID=B6U8K6_MAIZE|nr:hypothetical protein [Zea mays]
MPTGGPHIAVATEIHAIACGEEQVVEEEPPNEEYDLI